jgi:hypothetical protein
VSTSVSELIAAVALAWAARKVGAVADLRRVFAGPALAAGVAAAVMWVLRDELSAAVVGGMLAYAAILVAFERAVFPNDAGALLSSLRPRRGESAP